MKLRSLCKFRDWLFILLMDYFVNSGWVIIIKDFKKSEKINERIIIGLTDYENKTIYLDIDDGTARILVHELCHFALGVVLEKMAKNLPRKELKKLEGRYWVDKKFVWEELRTQEFEKYFYHSLSKGQIKILQGFIDEAMARYREE